MSAEMSWLRSTQHAWGNTLHNRTVQVRKCGLCDNSWRTWNVEMQNCRNAPTSDCISTLPQFCNYTHVFPHFCISAFLHFCISVFLHFCISALLRCWMLQQSALLHCRVQPFPDVCAMAYLHSNKLPRMIDWLITQACVQRSLANYAACDGPLVAWPNLVNSTF